MNDEVPGEGDFDAGRRRGEFDDITPADSSGGCNTWCFFGVATTARIRHLWKRNMLLSIAGGTAVYMLLIQLVF